MRENNENVKNEEQDDTNMPKLDAIVEVIDRCCVPRFHTTCNG